MATFKFLIYFKYFFNFPIESSLLEKFINYILGNKDYIITLFWAVVVNADDVRSTVSLPGSVQG